MSWTTRVRRYIALKAFQARQAYTNFREDAIALRHCWTFHLRMRTFRAWPFRLLAKLLSWGVKNSHGFGTFDSNRDGLSLSANHPIFDPKNDRLFSKVATMRAFEHIKMTEINDKSPEYVAEQDEAEELVRVQAQLADAIVAMQTAEARRVMRWKVIAVITVLAVIALGVLLFTQ